MRQRADDRGGQERNQDARDEMLRTAIARQADQHLPEPAEIDAQDRQDRAELDQHLEGLAGGFEAEKVAGQQDVPGGGNRNELGQTLQNAEQCGFDECLFWHGRAARDCLSSPAVAPIALDGGRPGNRAADN